MKIHVQGVDHVVLVNDSGVFIAVIDGIRYESMTLAGLRDKVARGHRHVEVAVPFTVIEGGLVRHGVANSVREIDGSIMVTWDTRQHGTLTWSHRTLKRLDPDESAEYKELCDVRDAAIQAVDRFERGRTINLKDEIAAARAGDERKEN